MKSFFTRPLFGANAKTLKKEWICQDVQAAYHFSGWHQFGIGLIPGNSDCKSIVQIVESELLWKPTVREVIMFPSEFSIQTTH